MVLAAGGGLLDGWGGMVNRWSGHVTTGFEPSTQPPYTAADTMPTHGGPGRFDTVAGLLAATPPQLRLLDSSLPDDAEVTMAMKDRRPQCAHFFSELVNRNKRKRTHFFLAPPTASYFLVDKASLLRLVS